MTALALYFIGRYSLPIKRICHLNINGQRFVGRTLALDVLAVCAPDSCVAAVESEAFVALDIIYILEI